MPTTGERPGIGSYACANCGTTVTLDDASDTLPPCPSCGGTDWGTWPIERPLLKLKSGSTGALKTKQVFLSYAQRDRDLADAVSTELRRRGIRVWDKTREIPSASAWSDAIGNALAKSDSMIALLNANSFSSEYVRKELDFALFDERYNNRLLPVLVGDAALTESTQLPWVLAKLVNLKLGQTMQVGEAAKMVVDAFVRLLDDQRSRS